MTLKLKTNFEPAGIGLGTANADVDIPRRKTQPASATTARRKLTWCRMGDSSLLALHVPEACTARPGRLAYGMSGIVPEHEMMSTKSDHLCQKRQSSRVIRGRMQCKKRWPR